MRKFHAALIGAMALGGIAAYRDAELFRIVGSTPATGMGPYWILGVIASYLLAWWADRP